MWKISLLISYKIKQTLINDSCSHNFSYNSAEISFPHCVINFHYHNFIKIIFVMMCVCLISGSSNLFMIFTSKGKFPCTTLNLQFTYHIHDYALIFPPYTIIIITKTVARQLIEVFSQYVAQGILSTKRFN